MSTPFRFKQFDIHHDRCAMKVGTDGVLLGAWTHIQTPRRVLDIGTGTGVIALMLAQRTASDVIIDAVELDTIAASQARDNVLQSPWPAKVHVHPVSIQAFGYDVGYDVIVSNPPFFNNSLKPADHARAQTRHTDTLPFSDLLQAVKRLLHPQGKFSIIIPATEGVNLIREAFEVGLYCTRRCQVFTRPDKPVERLLLELGHASHPEEITELVLHESGNQRSAAYAALTADFYLDR